MIVYWVTCATHAVLHVGIEVKYNMAECNVPESFLRIIHFHRGLVWSGDITRTEMVDGLILAVMLVLISCQFPLVK